MNKTEAVHHTKRANNRLKPVSDTCIKIFNNPGWQDAEKQLNLLQKRLDRELTPEDIDGEDLREAFDTEGPALREAEVSVDVIYPGPAFI